VYVFEGKPPELKMAQLRQRRERRDEATEGLAAAKEGGDQEAIEKYSKRTIKVGFILQAILKAVQAACPD